MKKNEHYLWLDLETTGTNENLDPILEIGLIVTDGDLNELAKFSSPIRPAMEWESAMNDYVLQMHTDSGLLQAVETYGRALPDVEQEIIRNLARFGKAEDFVLAGSGVSHFDRRFIKTWMGDLDKWLAYYSIDIGILRRTVRLLGREDLLLPEETKTHRALADVELHLREMRHLRASLAEVA